MFSFSLALVVYAVYTCFSLSAVSGQVCTSPETVGSVFETEAGVIGQGPTYILTEYTVQCEGIVTTWEFCYQRLGVSSVTFNPGIWERTGSTIYSLIQSNTVTFNPSVGSTFSCQNYILPVTEQFTAPSGSVVGLYSNINVLLLRTTDNSQITTYQVTGNQSSVVGGSTNDVNYNIAIRVHLDVPATISTLTSRTSTSVKSTMSLSAMFTASTSATPTTSTTIGSVGGGDSSSSSGSAGIIVGCVIGIIICIIVVFFIIILLWYRKQKKRKHNIPPESFELESRAKDSEPMTDNSNPHSVVNSQYSLIKSVDNDTGACKNTQPDYDIPNNRPANSSLYYSDPVTRDHPKVASNDYEAIPDVNEYHSTVYTYCDNDPMQSSNDTTLSHSTTYDDTKVSASINGSNEEVIYSDPGHSEEAIYAYFESKRFRIISESTVRILQKLGSGQFGIVHLGAWTDGSADPIQVAVKTLNSKCSESDRVKFLREAAIMGQFKNNHIVRLYGVVTEKEDKMIVLEYMPKGNLREFLIDLKNKTPPEAYSQLNHDLLSFCRQVSSGLSYLANKQFVHRDLAARNILVSSDDVCKIADFGMARDVSDEIYYMSSGGKIPVKWTAPEAILYNKYSTQSDVWSFGCVMYEIWSLGHKPFKDCDGRGCLKKITTGYRLPPPPGCPRAIYQLMILCWNPMARQRINPCEISRTLQKSDRTLLPNTASSDSEELSTNLRASLETSSHIFTDLQITYVPK